MTTATNLGYPRLGPKRELKWALEKYWRGATDAEALHRLGRDLRQARQRMQHQLGIQHIPANDFSFYDHVLDTMALVGAVPERYDWHGDMVDLETYFAMARGVQGQQSTTSRSAASADISAMEMTKWFDANYHYIVPEFAPGQRFCLASTQPIDAFLEARTLGLHTRPVLLGPVSFLLLGKATVAGFQPLTLLENVLPMYEEVLSRLAAHGADWVQIDEPCLVLDLAPQARQAFSTTHARLAAVEPRLNLLLATYFGDLRDNLSAALQLPVAALHLDLWCEVLALAIGTHAGLARRFPPLDTTSFARTGAYVPDRDEPALHLPPGSSQAHRADLPQAVVALLGSQDGGLPWGSKRGDGHPADTPLCQQRAAALRRACTDTPSPRARVAEAQRSWADQAPPSGTAGLAHPSSHPPPVGVARHAPSAPVGPLAACGSPHPLAAAHAGSRWHGPAWGGWGMHGPLLPLQAQRFGAPDAAHDARAALAQRWTSHRVASSPLPAHQRDVGTGRPTPRTPLQAIAWPIQAPVHADDEARERAQPAKACDVLGPNLDARAGSDTAVSVASQGQAQGDGGLRWLTAPRCFVASLLVKKPPRMAGLRMVMPRALLVYSVAQRRLRKP
jgi:Cobalamin-independent synthase, N-terminal domain